MRLPSAERLDGLRFGVPPELTGEGIEPGVREVFESTLELIESCYYPSKNERVDFIRKLDSEMDIKNVNVQKLGKLVSSGS